MDSGEVDIYVITDKGQRYTVDIKKTITCGEFWTILADRIIFSSYFSFSFNGKEYKNNKESTDKNDKLIYKKSDILNFNEGDIVYATISVTEEACTANVAFHLNVKVDEKDKSVCALSGILQLCLLKYIAKEMNVNDINKISSNEIRNIISDLKKEMDLSDDPQKDIKANLSQKEGHNIITYINYIKKIVTTKDIKELIKLFNKNKEDEIMGYWSQLSKYEDFNQLFERDFRKAIENSYFDYSLIGVSLYQQENRKKFIQDLNECENHEVKYLFHGTQIDPISKIITGGFLYTRKAFYGMGIYFSDMLDYISFYCGGETYEDRRKNFGKTIEVGKNFSCVATEVFYDTEKRKEVYDFSLHVKELDHFPSYEELEKNYPDKMVQKNGIHFARVEPQHGQVYENEAINIARRQGKFIGNEYVITEKEQMLPLYGLTLKRNEKFVVWRDPNFVGKNEYTDFLNNAKMLLYKNENINVFIENSTEKALELISKKRYNKIILISSVGLDLSGKTFVEAARKILGFDAVVLFFSGNSSHLKWIQNFPNALYTNNTNYYQKYIKNYNEKGLLNLKKEIEQNYKISLKFTKDYLKFPNYKNHVYYMDLRFGEVCPNFRKIIIKNRARKIALSIDDNRQVELVAYEGKQIEPIIWYATLIDGELTLYSNNSYLYYDEKSNIVKGDQFMKRWKYEKSGEQYYIYYGNKNNILTISGQRLIISNKKKKEDQLFAFVDECY